MTRTEGSDKGESEWNTNGSPREAAMTFIRGMNLRLYGDGDSGGIASKTLPQGTDPGSDEVIALKQVFDRLGELSPVDLPNGSSVEKSGITSFEVFPYGVDHAWIWEKLGKAPDGSIVLDKGEDGGWRFSQETLAGAPVLRDSMLSISPVYAKDGERELFTRVFSGAMEDSPWWSWLVLFAATVGAIAAGIYVRKGILHLGKKADLNQKSVVASTFRSVATAIAILAGVVIFIYGSSFVVFTPTLSGLYWGLVRVLLLIASVWVLFGLTDLVATLIRKFAIPDDNEYGEMAVTIVQRVLRSFLFVILAIFVLENMVGLNIGALITGLGIVGLALSLAGKEMAQNLFGAVAIFVNRPFVVGDWIEFEKEIGEVEDVNMQSTSVRLLSGEMLVIPNMRFISNSVENLSMRKYLRRTMDISLPYGTSPDGIERAMEILREVLTDEEVVEKGNCDIDNRPPVISFLGFESYYLHIQVYYWYFISGDGEAIQRNHERGWFSYLDHCSLVNTRIARAFAAEEIEFAFPTQTVHVEKEDKAEPSETAPG